jgi:uncharacterized protein
MGVQCAAETVYDPRGAVMGANQYHEPPAELSAETRTFARMCASLSEEAEAIGWYVQRMSIEPDAQARDIMTDSLGEEFKHFSMELEFLLRRTPKWREIAQGILFTEGDIVKHGENAEAAAD